jgi:hypothetical protein
MHRDRLSSVRPRSQAGGGDQEAAPGRGHIKDPVREESWQDTEGLWCRMPTCPPLTAASGYSFSCNYYRFLYSRLNVHLSENRGRAGPTTHHTSVPPSIWEAMTRITFTTFN